MPERPIPDVLHPVDEVPAVPRGLWARDDEPLETVGATVDDVGEKPLEPAQELTTEHRPWPPSPGAWVPPRTAEPEAAEPQAPVQPAPAVAPAPSWPPPGAAAPPPVAVAEPPPAPVYARAWDPRAAAAGEGIAAAPASVGSRVPRLALPKIDKEKVEAAADTVLLAGSVGLVVSFLLPWSQVVIGSRSTGGYTDQWGLAGPGHLVVFLFAVATLALSVLDNPIGRWLRTGVFGLVLGALALGMLWPYLFSRLGAGPGAVLGFVAALLLLVAGMVSILVLRHSALPPDV